MFETYKWEDLLAALEQKCPAKSLALQLNRRKVEYGFLSVGLKLHFKSKGAPEILELLQAVGGFEQRPYALDNAYLTYILPPVGNARTAIMLLESIEQYTDWPLFNNPKVTIQVCSPHRLDPENAAILAVCFYLGSDVLRRYTLSDFATTFSSETLCLNRGRRIVLYDGRGELDRNFEWWDRVDARLQVYGRLPFKHERTDVLTARTKTDILNINLAATLLSHYEHLAYWGNLGRRFKHDIEALLKEHMLEGLLGRQWIHAMDTEEPDDRPFITTFEELMNYAFDERTRLKKERQAFWRRRETQAPSILSQMKTLLDSYRIELEQRARSLLRKDER